MRSTIKRSVVLLATAGAVFTAGAGMASAAPAAPNAAPAAAPAKNCVLDTFTGAISDPAGTLQRSIANPVGAGSYPLACAINVLSEAAGMLPIPSIQ